MRHISIYLLHAGVFGGANLALYGMQDDASRVFWGGTLVAVRTLVGLAVLLYIVQKVQKDTQRRAIARLAEGEQTLDLVLDRLAR